MLTPRTRWGCGPRRTAWRRLTVAMTMGRGHVDKLAGVPAAHPAAGPPTETHLGEPVRAPAPADRPDRRADRGGQRVRAAVRRRPDPGQPRLPGAVGGAAGGVGDRAGADAGVRTAAPVHRRRRVRAGVPGRRGA